MSIDISTIFAPYGINFSNIDEAYLPSAPEFSWINLKGTEFVQVPNKTAHDCAHTNPQLAADTITQMIEGVTIQFHETVLNEAFNRSPEKSQAVWDDLVSQIDKLKTAGKFIMVDNFKNPKVNKLILDWVRARGFCIMYPSYNYEPDLDLYILNQVSSFAQLDRTNPSYC